MLLILWWTGSAPAGQQDIGFEPFLRCAGHQAYYLKFMETNGVEIANDVNQANREVAFYLQIAKSLSERHLKTEFIDVGNAERKEAEDVIKAGGNARYLSYHRQRRLECADLVDKHKDEILRAAKKLYD